MHSLEIQTLFKSTLTLNRKLIIGTLAVSVSVFALPACTTMARLGVGPDVVDPGTRTTSKRLDDINLAQSIRKDIYSAVPAAGDAHVDVNSFYQAILLTGEVPTNEMKSEIGAIAKRYAQVTVVHNELTVGQNRSLGERFTDGLLENKADFTLSNADGLRSEQSRVVAVNGTVYLMGKLTQREADRAIVRLQALDGIRRIVKMVDVLPEPTANPK